MTTQEIPFPHKGLSLDESPGNQRQLTTRDCLNVVGYDPPTGARRPGQREGSILLTSEALAGPPRELASVSAPLPMVRFTQLTEVDNGVSEPGLITTERSTSLPTKALVRQLVLDPTFGDVFALGSQDRLHRYTPDLRLVESVTLQLPTSTGEALALAVDGFRRIYVSGKAAADGDGGLVWCYEWNDKELRLLWTLETPGTPTTLVVSEAVLQTVEEFTEGDAFAKLAGYGGIFTTQPYPLWTNALPAPVSDTSIAGDGSILVASAPNPNRGQSPDSGEFTTQSVSWVPHELADASNRLFLWLSAEYVTDKANGDEVDIMPDRRYATTYDGATFAGPGETQDVERNAFRHESADKPDARFPPTWRSNAAGPNPGVHFSATAAPADPDEFTVPGQVLRMDPNSAYSPGSRATGDITFNVLLLPLLNHTVIIPDGVSTLGIEFTQGGGTTNPESDVEVDMSGMSSVTEIVDAVEAAILASSLTIDVLDKVAGTIYLRNQSYGAAGNVAITDVDDSPNYITFNGFSGGADAPPTTIRSMFPALEDVSFAICWLVRIDKSNRGTFILGQNGDTKFRLFCHISDGYDVDSEGVHVDSGEYGWVYLDIFPTSRISGSAGALGNIKAARFNLRVDASENTTQCAIISFVHGGANAGSFTSGLRVNGVAADRFELGQTYSYGDIAEATRLGCPYIKGTPGLGADLIDPATGFRSFSGAILDAIGWIATPGNPITWPSIAAGADSGSDPAAATEVEYMEGYLANRAGVAHILPYPSTTGTATGGPYPSPNHPFGGPGNPPSGTGGGQALNPFGDALNSVNGVTSKWRTSGSLAWAIAAGGMGRTVAGNGDGGVFAAGDKLAGGDGPSGKDEDDVIARKLVDLGSSVSALEDLPAVGTVDLSGQPDDASTITISDGTTAVAFEFTSGGGLTVGDVEVVKGGDADATTGALHAAINLHAFDVESVWDLASHLDLENQTHGTVGDVAIVLVDPAGAIAVTGMGGGDDEGDGAWVITDADDDHAPNAASSSVADDGGDFYWPVVSATQNGLVRRVAAEDGSIVYTHDMGGGRVVGSVTLPLSVPDYHGQEVTGPEFIFVSTDFGTGGVTSPVVHKLRVVAVDEEAGENLSHRRTCHVALAGGNLYRIESDGTWSIPTGGTGAYRESTPILASVVIGRKLYGLDGLRYFVFDPRITSENPNGIVEELLAEGGGEIPPRARLMDEYGGRLVLANFTDNPSGYIMSAVGAPTDFRLLNEDGLSPKDAVGGQNAPPGDPADIINGTLSLGDDILLLFGDRTINRISGNPAAGGQLDSVTKQVGGAFGTPAIQGPDGLVFFVASTGGFWALTGNGPRSISRGSIERRLQQIDFSSTRVRLAWDHRNDGIRLAIVPILPSNTSDRPEVWCWDRRADAWWPYEWASRTIDPVSLAVLDGDEPSDRRIAYGALDGQVRVFDGDARSDSGSPIRSRVLIGPILGNRSELQGIFDGIEATLSSEQQTATLAVYVSDTPDDPGQPQIVETLNPGYNPPFWETFRGRYVWFELSNVQADERWSLEALRARWQPGGMGYQ